MQVAKDMLAHSMVTKFQFPSNGKAEPKNSPEVIDFGAQEFQFPSNGKAEPKTGHILYREHPHRWVRFQFPSNGKVYPKEWQDNPVSTSNGFNSLQTGKRIQRLIAALSLASIAMAFQFPSNGKAYPKAANVVGLPKQGFKCFNSLQTGKQIQRGSRRDRNPHRHTFQFPSNGKAYPKDRTDIPKRSEKLVSIPFKRESVSKASIRIRPTQVGYCFNSLQTGKRIQRWMGFQFFGMKIQMFQFPSNGKAYPKKPSAPALQLHILFQFPSNGKAYPKRLSCATRR